MGDTAEKSIQETWGFLAPKPPWELTSRTFLEPDSRKDGLQRKFICERLQGPPKHQNLLWGQAYGRPLQERVTQSHPRKLGIAPNHPGSLQNVMPFLRGLLHPTSSPLARKNLSFLCPVSWGGRETGSLLSISPTRTSPWCPPPVFFLELQHSQPRHMKAPWSLPADLC